MRGEVDSSDPVNWDASLNASLVSWWKALPDQQRGNVWRDIASHNHGTLTGGPLWSGLSHPGGWGSLSLDGSDDFVNPGSALGITSFPFSFGGWVRPAATATTATFFSLCRFRTDSAEYYTLEKRSSVYSIVARNSTFTSAGGTTASTLNVWAHVFGVFAGDTEKRLYVNGKEEANNTNSVTFSVNTDRFLIGKLRDGTADIYAGSIADVCAYNRALSASEVSALYQQSLAGDPDLLNWQRRLVYFDTGAAPGGLSIPVAMHNYRRRRVA